LVLRILACLALVVLLAILWRARPGYGRTRSLPPGSLALAPLGPWVDHLDYQKRAERYGTVFKMSRFVEPMVCIVGLDTARSLLRNHDDDLIVPPLPFTRLIPRGFLRYMDSADHRPYAALFRTAFVASVVHDREAAIAQIFRRELRQLAEDSTARDDVDPRLYISRMVYAACI